MYLVKPSFKILSEFNGLNMLMNIEYAGRTCYKSEEKVSINSCEKFVEMIIRRGHESVLEHEKITVKVICDRGVTHEIVRHRIASYSQESTRYCNYKGGVTFIIPPWFSLSEGEYTVDTSINPHAEMSDESVWLIAMQLSENTYLDFLSRRWKPEMARSVLPNSLKTEIVITMNLREWRHFFKLRTTIAAHPQMREIAVPMLNEFKSLIPVVFDDILI